MASFKLHPVHPGEILHHEFLEPLKLSQRKLALDLAVPPNRINAIVNGTRGITGDTALRLSRYFGTTPQLWLNLQAEYELDKARLETGSDIENIEPLVSA